MVHFSIHINFWMIQRDIETIFDWTEIPMKVNVTERLLNFYVPNHKKSI